MQSSFNCWFSETVLELPLFWPLLPEAGTCQGREAPGTNWPNTAGITSSNSSQRIVVRKMNSGMCEGVSLNTTNDTMIFPTLFCRSLLWNRLNRLRCGDVCCAALNWLPQYIYILNFLPLTNEEGYVSHFSDFANLNSICVFPPVHLVRSDLSELSQ